MEARVAAWAHRHEHDHGRHQHRERRRHGAGQPLAGDLVGVAAVVPDLVHGRHVGTITTVGPAGGLHRAHTRDHEQRQDQEAGTQAATRHTPQGAHASVRLAGRRRHVGSWVVVAFAVVTATNPQLVTADPPGGPG